MILNKIIHELTSVIAVPFITIAYVAIVITSKLVKIQSKDKSMIIYVGSNGDVLYNWGQK